MQVEKNPDPQFVNGLHAAWQREMWTARTYRALAAREANDSRRDVLLQLVANEDSHAERTSRKRYSTSSSVASGGIHVAAAGLVRPFMEPTTVPLSLLSPSSLPPAGGR